MNRTSLGTNSEERRATRKNEKELEERRRKL
jgi:hypothetical protein